MLIVQIHNDGTGTQESSNYNVKILVTITPSVLKTIATARITGHNRGDGWRKILQRVIDTAEDTGL